MASSALPNVGARSTPMEWGPVVVAAVFVGLFVFLFFNGAARMPLVIAAFVASGPAVGFYAGGYRGRLRTKWLSSQCDVSATALGDIDGGRECPPGREFREGQFLTTVAFACLLYVVFYYICANRMAPGRDDSAFMFVTLTTAATLGALGLAAVRYACYVRMITLLKAALEQKGRDLKLIENLRRAAFREEQLFEPAGNVFVMIGIMATFLGLAAGLANFDPLGFFAEGKKDIAMASLKSFAACMALGLGVSMLGVAVALSAQWLRGNGPSMGTAELLEKAAKC